MVTQKLETFIHEIRKDDGTLLTTQTKIQKHVVDYFESKFKEKEVEDPGDFLNAIPRVVTDDANLNLLEIPQYEEIRRVVFELNQDSAPRPDGFPGCFYRAAWPIIFGDVMDVIQYCFRIRNIPRGLNNNFIILN